ncbi:hypothetical protein BDV25DRAFT_156797 [Aspergillus avenaceus]|uniref:Uncharacterized protein n=1 Tax=Aspergillus avenaceus TaxID=36643 RepID=A0A5N6TS30_ASPAV|nr:hypothetical protein BDV25DRAFT_156797 [Aspergillus avenaceus]
MKQNKAFYLWGLLVVTTIEQPSVPFLILPLYLAIAPPQSGRDIPECANCSIVV